MAPRSVACIGNPDYRERRHISGNDCVNLVSVRAYCLHSTLPSVKPEAAWVARFARSREGGDHGRKRKYSGD
ncbi:hypothetical protein PHLCEN_2v1607 [Hermanssonia centrifuga]|uniref:Uncharacterized protein n=1 Tax=Hermanssonia centrifuga TaxID=98765 RepID=A0A2R6RZI6_9APHY|nr:hypothetical protein PHLCEN_2v1607 [Hermanssonia centrifuga]